MTLSTARCFAMTLGFLSLLVPAAPVEAAGDAARSACLAEVRQEMGRFEVQALDPKMEEAVGGFCARGDVEGALRLAIPAAAAERCVRRVREVAAGEPVPSQEDLSRAYQLCRRGDPEAAFALVGAGPDTGTTPPDGAPDPTGPAGPAGPPTIFRFQATPSTLRAGEPSRLLWDVYSSSAVTLDREAVAPRGERVVRPSRTTRYTLAAGSPVDSIAETVTVTVSPYPPATLGASLQRIEVCRELRSDGEEVRCIASDGPFYAGDAVQVILRFDGLSAGSHALEYELFAGDSTQPQRWTRIDHAQGPFSVGEGASPRPGTGRRPERSMVRDHRSSAEPPAAPASKAPPGRMAAGGAFPPTGDPIAADPGALGKPPVEDDPAPPEGSWKAFALADQGKGPRKLVVILDGREATRSEILYCVECPGHDEW